MNLPVDIFALYLIFGEISLSSLFASTMSKRFGEIYLAPSFPFKRIFLWFLISFVWFLKIQKINQANSCRTIVDRINQLRKQQQRLRRYHCNHLLLFWCFHLIIFEEQYMADVHSLWEIHMKRWTVSDDTIKHSIWTLIDPLCIVNSWRASHLPLGTLHQIVQIIFKRIR